MTIVCTTNEGLFAKCSPIIRDNTTDSDNKLLIKFEHIDSNGISKIFASELEFNLLASLAKSGDYYY